MVGRRRDASQYYMWEERQQVLKAMMEANGNHGLLSRSLKNQRSVYFPASFRQKAV